MVERASLESLYTRKGIEGSNPSLSAKHHPNRKVGIFVFYPNRIYSNKDKNKKSQKHSSGMMHEAIPI